MSDELGELLVKIEADLAELKKSLTGAEKLTKKAGKSMSGSMGKAMKKVAKVAAIGVAAGTAIVAAGTVKMVKDSVSAFSDYEQQIGGSEAVWGKYASSIQQSASQAYANMGMSANEYMATANKMGMLFQGSGLSATESLNLTQESMQRAADVASVMGITTEAAMESVAGAAKGNFTMMDNLGVAMNATSLEAYALEKGVNFKWDTASNADKARLAMEMFMDRSAKAAGNFRKESFETISGSMAMLKSSYTNLLAAMGSGDTKMISQSAEAMGASFGAVLQNLIPVVRTVITVGIPTAIKAGAPAIEKALNDAFPKEIQALEELANNLANNPVIKFLTSDIGRAATTAATSILILGAALSKLSGAFAVIKGAVAVVGAVLGALSLPVLVVVGSLAALAAAGYYIYQNWATIGPQLQALWTSIFGSIGPIITTVAGVIKSVWNSIVSYLNGVWSAIKGPVNTLWKAIKSLITTTVNEIGKTLKTWGGWLKSFFTSTMGIIAPIVSTIMKVIVPIWKAGWTIIGSVVKPLLTGIINTVTNAINLIKGVIVTVMSVLRGDWQGAWDGIKQIVSSVLGTIKSIISTAWNVIKSVATTSWALIKGAVSKGINAMKNKVNEKMGEVKTAITNAWNDAIAVFANLYELGKQFASDFVKGLIDGLKAGASKVKNAALSIVPGRSTRSRALGEFDKFAKLFMYAGEKLSFNFVKTMDQGHTLWLKGLNKARIAAMRELGTAKREYKKFENAAKAAAEKAGVAWKKFSKSKHSSVTKMTNAMKKLTAAEKKYKKEAEKAEKQMANIENARNRISAGGDILANTLELQLAMGHIDKTAYTQQMAQLMDQEFAQVKAWYDRNFDKLTAEQKAQALGDMASMKNAAADLRAELASVEYDKLITQLDAAEKAFSNAMRGVEQNEARTGVKDLNAELAHTQGFLNTLNGLAGAFSGKLNADDWEDLQDQIADTTTDILNLQREIGDARYDGMLTSIGEAEAAYERVADQLENTFLLSKLEKKSEKMLQDEADNAKTLYDKLLAIRSQIGGALKQAELDSLNKAITSALKGWRDITDEINKATTATDQLNNTVGGANPAGGPVSVSIRVDGNADKKTVTLMADEMVKILRRKGL